jgi:indolepyruvate ferredoxin oxidoreductase beta subunit
MPTPGDVDVVIASELMESARAVQRGIVTPDKTLLITSCSRVYAMPEKMAMGDGRASTQSFIETGRKASQKYVARDFAQLAEKAGSVISATLFGALAASGTLPWTRSAFESAIERGGIGVSSSLKAFAAGFDAFASDPAEVESQGRTHAPPSDPRLASLLRRARAEFPSGCVDLVEHGIARTADYQDLAYAAEYLDRLGPILALDHRFGDGRWRLTQETARYLALWMTFEDTARVAELKLRSSRFQRVHREVRAGSSHLVHINEFFHPRPQELADTAPAGLGRWLLAGQGRMALLERMTQEGRIIRTSSLAGFLTLYAVASCRHFRRRSLRYQRELAGMNEWLARIQASASQDYALACEVVECQRLIKGYGDTHARGMANYQSILAALDRPRAVDAKRVRALREAALQDETGAQLQALLQGL